MLLCQTLTVSCANTWFEARCIETWRLHVHFDMMTTDVHQDDAYSVVGIRLHLKPFRQLRLFVLGFPPKSWPNQLGSPQPLPWI